MLIVFVIVFLPLLVQFGSSFKELYNSLFKIDLNSINSQIFIFFKSVGIAFLASTFSLFLGIPLAFFYTRTNLHLKRYLKILCFVPFFIPPYIQAYAWILLLGENGSFNKFLMRIFAAREPIFSIYGMGGVVFVLAISYFPVMMFLAISGLESADPELEEAHSLYAGGFNSFRKITLPLIYPHIIGGFVLTFIFSLAQFGVPALLEVRSYSVNLFVQISAFFDESSATLNSIPVLLMTVVIMFVLSLTWEKGFFTVFPEKKNHRIHELNTLGQAAGTMFSFLVILFSVILPVFELIRQSGNLTTFIKSFKLAVKPIMTSSFLALLATILIIFFSMIWILTFYKSRLNLLLRLISIFPLGIPGAILGLSLINLWNNKVTGFIYSSFFIVVIVYIARFIPYGVLAIHSNLKQLESGMLEAAFISGAGPLKTFKGILFPLLKPGFTFTAIVCFILCIGELQATIMVIPPGMETLSLRIYSLMHYGESGLIAASSLIPLLLSFFAYFIFIIITKAHDKWKSSKSTI